MNTVDQIKLLHNVSFLTRWPTAGWIGGAVDRYEAFSPAEKQQLGTPVRLLADYLKLQARPPSDPILLQLACLAPGVLRSSNDPIATVSEKRGGYTEKKLGESTKWLEESTRLLRAYANLPLA